MGCCGEKASTGNKGRSRLIKKKKLLTLKKEREEIVKKTKESK